MIFTIPVTAAHIARGKPQEACDCPVWHAIAEALPWLLDTDPTFTVCSNDVTIYRPSSDNPYRLYCIEFPDVTREFIGRFDSVLPVEPFEFTLDIPDHLVAAGFVPAGGEH
jgi:hypothetical protein